MSSTNWLCTLNNPDTATTESYLKSWKDYKHCNYVTGQVEQGDKGTVHIQYFLNFSQKVRMAHLKKHCKQSHFEIVKQNNGADKYCNKDDTRIEGPWSFGILPAKRNVKGDLKRRNADIENMGAVEAAR